MTTSIMTIGSTKISKQSLLGGAEISAEGAIVPQENNQAENLFLPMFLQMLFAQNPAVPQKLTEGELSLGEERQSGAAAVPEQSAPVSILAGSIDGLTRLTMERTQPALDALKAHLAQMQRLKEGEESSLILPSLFGRNLRMPVGNIQEIIDAVSFNAQPRPLTMDVSEPQVPIILDIEAAADASAAEILLPQSAPSAAPNTDAERNAEISSPQRPVLSEGHIELDDTNSQPAQIVKQQTDGQESPRQNRTAVRRSEPMSDAASQKNFNQEAAVITQSADQAALKNLHSDEQPSGEQTRSVPEYAAAPTVKPRISEQVTEKKGRTVRSSSEENGSGSDQRNITEEHIVTTLPVSADREGKETSTDGQPQNADHQLQSAHRGEAGEFRKIVTDVDAGVSKISSVTNEVRTAEALPAGTFKPETVRSMMEQLSKGVAVAVNEDHSEMKLILHPEALGEVTVRVQVEEGKVTAKLDVQQAQVKNTIEANIPQLREALTSRGLTMERIEISTAQNGLANGTAKNHQNKQGKRSGQLFGLAEEEEQDIVKMYGYNTVEYTI